MGLGVMMGAITFIVLSILVVSGAMWMQSNTEPSNLTGTENWTEQDWQIHKWLKGEGPHPADIKK